MQIGNGPVITIDADVKAFLRSFANECSGCMRRSEGNCAECVCGRAKRLLEGMEAKHEIHQQLRCDPASRMIHVLLIMRKAKRPLRSCEIDMHNYCNRVLKRWTLRQMVKRGTLEMIFDGEHYVYSLPKKQTTTTKQGERDAANERSRFGG